MLKSYLFHIGLAVVLLSATMQSCKKSDGVNNNQVIETPYGIYYADSTGALYNTNDGNNIKPMIFPPDGTAARAVCTSGDNLLWVKKSYQQTYNLQVSTDNGKDFNVSYKTLNLYGIAATSIYNSVDENRMYIASTTGRLGVFYSDKNGALNSWLEDSYDTLGLTGTVTITSFTELQNNTMIGYDSKNYRSFYKASKSDLWHETTGTAKLPTGGQFSISHIVNTVVAVDYTGVKGAYYSTDNGNTWKAYTGLPHTKLLSVAAPFDQVLLVGTDSVGIYSLSSGGVFVPANNGLGTYSVVNGIAGKENIYKNVIAPQQYIYIATNQGLFRSSDLGQNWTLAQSGNIVAVF